MAIDDGAIKDALDAYGKEHGSPQGISERDAMVKAIEAYEGAKFADVEPGNRPWFVAHFDFHKALGLGMTLDDALWIAIQAYEGQNRLEDGGEVTA